MLHYSNGASYTGAFKDGLFHGHCVLVTAAGDRLEGRFIDGTMNGAFFEESLQNAETFKTAFERASVLVSEREAKEEYNNSEPQFAAGEAILAKLKRWRNQLHAGSLAQMK